MHAAFIDTDMARGAPGPKIAPDDVVAQAIAALEAGQQELLADVTTRNVRAGLSAEPPVYLATARVIRAMARLAPIAASAPRLQLNS